MKKLDGRTKLTADVIEHIRVRYAQGFTDGRRNGKHIPLRMLAVAHGISTRYALDLVHGEARAKVSGAIRLGHGAKKKSNSNQGARR